MVGLQLLLRLSVARRARSGIRNYRNSGDTDSRFTSHIIAGRRPPDRSIPRKRDRGRGLHTDRGAPRYRTQIAILRDFLLAARVAGRRTRIIGLANLNPRSYRTYLSFCLKHDLILESPNGLRLTARADTVLESIDRVLAQSARLHLALGQLAVELGTVPIGTAPLPACLGLPRLDAIGATAGGMTPTRPSSPFEVHPLGSPVGSENWIARSGGRTGAPGSPSDDRVPEAWPAPPVDPPRRDRGSR